MTVIVLVADGARVDAFTGDLAGLPALKQLRDDGGLHEITTVFPSVTGPAYLPFLTGRFPGPAGVPGIRWFDRERIACSWPDYARSYVGYQFSRLDADLDPCVPTIFELAPNSVGALSVITRGLAPARRLGTLTMRSAARVAFTHFRGRPEHWLNVDRQVRDTVPRRIRDEQLDYVFAAFTGMDKASHAYGHDSLLVKEALEIIDETVAQIRLDAERAGQWHKTHLWIVSDHGHSPVHSHEDLAGLVSSYGVRAAAHPWTIGIATEAMVMVSGNAMAHVYLDPAQRERQWWTSLAHRWHSLAHQLLERESVDLMLLPLSENRCEVRSASRGNAMVSRAGELYSYIRSTGDPLGYGSDLCATADDAHSASRTSDYPDALVQIISLCGSARAGDIVLSARPGWDFRARYEPIPHVSSHGALHRDHMVVPLLTNHPPCRTPRRTADVFASSITALGIAPPERLDGQSFV